MGVRGLYSSLKAYAIPIKPEEELSLRIGIDSYALLYKYKEQFDDLFAFVRLLQAGKHSILFVLDGVPPPEKQEELALRKAQRKEAAQQAKALREFLQDSSAQELASEAKELIQKKIQQYDNESWAVYKELRDNFVWNAKERGYPVHLSKGEADEDLVQMSRHGEIDVVLANDMDYFVYGVERLWIVNKEFSEPREFRHSDISRAMSIQPSAWKDIAILAGYEKTPQLRRVPISSAISLLRFYGSFERLFWKRSDLLGGEPMEEFLTARRFFE